MHRKREREKGAKINILKPAYTVERAAGDMQA
jgi:hypothetical protein